MSYIVKGKDEAKGKPGWGRLDLLFKLWCKPGCILQTSVRFNWLLRVLRIFRLHRHRFVISHLKTVWYEREWFGIDSSKHRYWKICDMIWICNVPHNRLAMKRSGIASPSSCGCSERILFPYPAIWNV
jgi:hypothetical protein